MIRFAVETVSGADALPFVQDLAALRIEVFREFPYLYEGSLENEARYLRGYGEHEGSVIVLARDLAHEPARVIGASTAMPALEHGDGIGPALARGGLDPSRVFYFGESVLRAAYRGQGLGHAFFDAREAKARELGFAITAFCAVKRPEDHPARPRDYVPHDAFWSKRGYTRRDDIVASFSWRDVGEAAATEKPMVFWVRELPR